LQEADRFRQSIASQGLAALRRNKRQTWSFTTGQVAGIYCRDTVQKPGCDIAVRSLERLKPGQVNEKSIFTNELELGHSIAIREIAQTVNPGVVVLAVEGWKAKCFRGLGVEAGPVSDSSQMKRHVCHCTLSIWLGWKRCSENDQLSAKLALQPPVKAWAKAP
jgi:hypothetical protein